MGGLQFDPGCASRVVGLDPAPQTEAPEVARLESGKLVLRHRRRQIVAALAREFEKLGRHFRTDGVHATVIAAGIAKPIAKEAGEGIAAAGDEVSAENIACHSSNLIVNRRTASFRLYAQRQVETKAAAACGVVAVADIATQQSSQLFDNVQAKSNAGFARSRTR